MGITSHPAVAPDSLRGSGTVPHGISLLITAMIRVYDVAGNMIDTRGHARELKRAAARRGPTINMNRASTVICSANSAIGVQ